MKSKKVRTVNVHPSPKDLGRADSIEFKCPFCKKACIAGDISFEGVTEITGVMHEEPICETFAEKDPLSFLELVNDKTIGPGVMEKIRAAWKRS